MVSPWTPPFVVQAHDDRIRAWCAWLPWISRSVCAIRRHVGGQRDVSAPTHCPHQFEHLMTAISQHCISAIWPMHGFCPWLGCVPPDTASVLWRCRYPRKHACWSTSSTFDPWPLWRVRPLGIPRGICAHRPWMLRISSRTDVLRLLPIWSSGRRVCLARVLCLRWWLLASGFLWCGHESVLLALKCKLYTVY